ncbi:MAG: phage terminase large subunit [Deltaproteobacteria bacterium]
MPMIVDHVPQKTYLPLPWQLAPLADQARVVLMTGSAGGGKSRTAAEKLHAFLLKYPGATGLMLRKIKEHAGKSIVPFFEHLVADDSVVKRISGSMFRYANGSVLYWGGMQEASQREGIRSMGKEGGLEMIWLEEAHQFSEQDFNELLARLRGVHSPWRQIILTTNPDAPTHWIYKRLIQDG